MENENKKQRKGCMVCKRKTISTIIPPETELLSIACIKRVAEIFSFWLNIDGIFPSKRQAAAAVYTNGCWIFLLILQSYNRFSLKITDNIWNIFHKSFSHGNHKAIFLPSEKIITEIIIIMRWCITNWMRIFNVQMQLALSR